MFTLRQYLTTLADTHGLTRTMGDIDVCRDGQGRMCYTVGNSAIVFRIRHRDGIRSLRCYMHPPRHLAEIYGDRLLPQELFLYTSPRSGVWVDVVLGEWIEGITLHEAATGAASAGDTPQLLRLAEAFDRMAAALTSDDWAHGDLKPENIIVDPAGGLHLIDFDATYLPAFAGEASPELGTAAFQHPARTIGDFDASLDDYPAALISTALHALALDPELYTRYPDADGLLFTPQQIAGDEALREAVALFEHEGCALQYRIARMLYAPTPRLFGLAELLARAVRDAGRQQGPGPDRRPAGEPDTGPDKGPDGKPDTEAADPGSIPELFVANGLWGYRTPERIVIPPLYDSGFDFTEGLAAVRIGTSWHYIDTEGRTRIRCTGCEAVKPFRNGRAGIVRNGRRLEIDRTGHEFEI